MGTGQPQSEADPESAATTIHVQCGCGRWLDADTQHKRVSCECGRVLAVTETDEGETVAPILVE